MGEPDRRRAEPERLAVYGSLAPGRSNHHLLAGLAGTWRSGWVRGRLLDRGWGAGLGFPGLVPDPAGARVRVHVLEAAGLADAWERLDRFEGPEYRRVTLPVEGVEGTQEPLLCQAYVLRG